MAKTLTRRAVLKGSDAGLASAVVRSGAGGAAAAGRSPILCGLSHHRWRAVRRATVLLLCGVMAPSPAMAQLHPGNAGDGARGSEGLFVVRNALAQFKALKHHPEALGWRLRNPVSGLRAPVPGPGIFNHYQGLVRDPETGLPPVFYVSQNQTTGGGYLLVVEFGSRTTRGERLRSNLQQVGEDTVGTVPPRSDSFLRLIRFDWTTAAPLFDGQRLPAYKHPGGMAVVGGVLFLSVDQPVSAADPKGYLLMFDVSADPTHPVPLQALPLDQAIDNVAVTRRSDGRYLIWANGDGGEAVNVYETTSTDLRDNHLRLSRLPSPPRLPADWPTGAGSHQSSTFLRDSHGNLYLIGMRHPGGLDSSGSDYADLYHVADQGSRLVLTHSLTRHLYCVYDGGDILPGLDTLSMRVCNMAAADNAYVSPSGELILYSSPHEEPAPGVGPAGIVRMGEFRDRDVLHEGNPLLNATAKASGCQVNGGRTVELLGPDAEPADRPWVELYDDVNFADRSIVVDYDDRALLELYDFRKLDKFNDKTSSVRWRAPQGCNIVLYEHRDFKGNQVVLHGTGRTEAISSLKERSFNDKTSSLGWQEDRSVTFRDGLTTLGLRLSAPAGTSASATGGRASSAAADTSAGAAAPIRTVRLRLPEVYLRPLRAAGRRILPRLSADGHRLLRRYIHLKGNELTVHLRDARSVRLRWRGLRARGRLAAALRARLRARLAGKRLNLVLHVTDANGNTQRLQLVLRPRLAGRRQAPPVTG